MSETFEHLLQPIDDGAPAGPNLEYDSEFQALEELARPRPERALGAGVIASEQPQWRHVAEQAGALLQRSRDLRIAVQLCAARLHLEGLAGWSDGLALVRGLLEQQWDHVHPQLDADADNDPVERINALAALGDAAMLAALRSTRLFRGVHPAHFSLRELRLAQGVQRPAEHDEDERPDLAAIEACMIESPIDALAAMDAALLQAGDHLEAIVQVFTERTPGRGPALDAPLRDVRELRAFVHPHLAARDASIAQQDSVADMHDGSAPEAPRSANATIERPEDVIRALDQICDYYARREPSSPIPLLLRRAQRLVGMDFAALLRDLAPGGISELQVVSGQEHDE